MKINENKLVYTVGHSNHTIDYFAELLNTFSVNCLIDIRSAPGSSYSPQFNKEFLQRYLKSININYLHFGEEFGARHTEKELLDNWGKVDFEKVRETPKFLSGIDRLNSGLEKGYIIALMCSEADPFDCHRFSMISYYLVNNGFTVKHILKDKTVIDNDELEKRLLKKYEKQIPKTSLFETFTDFDQLSLAYRLRNRDVAFDTLNL